MTREMVRYYARRAAEYEHVYELPHWQPGLARLQEMVAAIFPGRRVLEVACGTGYWTVQLAAIAARVSASDINEETLDFARARVGAHPHVTLRPADAYDTPAEPETFDAGLAALWLSHVDRARMDDFLAAFHARLEPGARVLMFDERDHPTRTARPGQVDAAGNRYEWRRLENGDRYEIIKNLFDDRELTALLGPWGTDVLVEDLGRFWAATYRARGGAA
jgi:demethylmenaquinone methyltransferase/2-methoxy-6-polyprenyl-1,4-benzoquinol methylase